MRRRPTPKQLEVERAVLAEAFAAARNESGLSLRELSQMTALGLQTIVRIEAGAAGVGLANLQTALGAVGLKIEIVRRD